MWKYLTFLTAPAASDAAAFKAWVLREAPPVLGAVAPRARLSISVVDMIAPWEGDLADAETRRRQPFDVLVETWRPPEEPIGDPWTADGPRSILNVAGDFRTYRVSEFVEKDAAPCRSGLVPGIRLLSVLHGRSDLDDRQIKLGWDRHVPPAMSAHRAMRTYIRNWVEEPMTPGAPHIHGLAALGFATDDDLRRRFFDSPAGEEAMAEDTPRFLQKAVNVYAREYTFQPA